MNPYTIALFLHVIGAVALFIGLGTLTFANVALRRVRRVEQLRALVEPLTAGRNIGFEHISAIDLVVLTGVVLIGLSAAYMVTSAWSFEVAWIRVAIAGTLLVAPLGPALVNPRLHALARACGPLSDGPLDASLIARTRDPVLTMALAVMISTLVGVVFLMTNKPPALESLAAIAISMFLGLVVGAAGTARDRRHGA